MLSKENPSDKATLLVYSREDKNGTLVEVRRVVNAENETFSTISLNGNEVWSCKTDKEIDMLYDWNEHENKDEYPFINIEKVKQGVLALL